MSYLALSIFELCDKGVALHEVFRDLFFNSMSCYKSHLCCL